MGKILVLYYHKVCDLVRDWNGLAVSPKTFMEQMQYIKEHYGILRADADWNNCTKDSVIVTFDDGYEDNYTNALPILEKLEVPATFFVSTGNLDSNNEVWCNELIWLIFEGSKFEDKFVTTGTAFQFEYETSTLFQQTELYRILRSVLPCLSWKDRERIMEDLRVWGHASDREKRTTHKMMTSEQVMKLSNSKYAVIGAHTVNHPSLGGLTYEEQFEEIYNSKMKLEKIIQKKVELFSYPFGGGLDYSDDTISILKKLEFTKAMTTEQSCIKNIETGLYEIPRVCIKESSMKEFSEKLKTFFGLREERGKECTPYSFEYVGKMEEDQSLFRKNINIVIWGAGGRCKWVLDKLSNWNLLDKVKCIYDSSKEKSGMFIKDIPIFELKEYKETENEIFIIAISQIGKTFDQIKKYQFKNIHYYI